MKILFLLTQDLESPSALGRIFPLARELVILGHQVNMLALHSNYQDLISNLEHKDGVNIRYAGQMHVMKKGDQKTYFTAINLIYLSTLTTFSLIYWTLRTKADIVHICKPHPMNSIAGFVGKIINRKVIFLDYDDHEAESMFFTKGWQKKIIEIFENNTPKFVDHITTHNTYLENRLVDSGINPKKITYIPTCVDSVRFSDIDQEKLDVLKKKLNITDQKIISYIGTLSLVNHPIDLLIKAYASVLEEFPNSLLMLVGGGQDYQILVEKVRQINLNKNVIFIGRVSPSQVPYYYKISDVVIDPVYDNPACRGRIPLKMFESWISGVPFVTGDVGDRRFLLGDPPAGYLAAAGNAISLAEGINKILYDNKYTKELILRGYHQGKLYIWSKQILRLESVYKLYF